MTLEPIPWHYTKEKGINFHNLEPIPMRERGGYVLVYFLLKIVIIIKIENNDKNKNNNNKNK